MGTTIEIPPCSADGVDLFLVFNVKRGKPIDFESPKEIVGIELVRDGPRKRPLPRNVLHLRLRQKCGRNRIRVKTTVEPLDLVKVIYRDPARKKLLVHAVNEAGQVPEQAVEIEDDDRDDKLLEEILDTNKYVQEIEQALLDLVRNNDPRSKSSQYFWDLDRETHADILKVAVPSEIARELRAKSINRAMSILNDRLVERAKLRKNGQAIAPLATPISKDDLDFLKGISDLQLQILRKHFDITSQSGLSDFEQTFERFANGELRLRLKSGAYACQPSSGYYFFFAEFALLAADTSAPLAAYIGAADAATWGKVCNVLVRTQKIFCEVYASSNGSPLTFEAYAASNYQNTRKPFEEPEKQVLRNDFKNATFAKLCEGTADYAKTFLGGLFV